MNEKATIRSADQVDPLRLHNFLSRFYPAKKCAFLRDHGAWWHGGDENRWVLWIDDEIAGYCAVIPTQVVRSGETIPAIWWVDLVIAPEFRGQGMQSLFDEKIRRMDLLKLGFPNALAAKIHRKHQWGVREDFKVLLLPLQPNRLNAVRNAMGWRGGTLRMGANLLRPLAWGARRYYRQYKPGNARRLLDSKARGLANIFARFGPADLTTTLRDEGHFQWRYLETPYRHELKFYTAGPENSPTHVLIARQTQAHGQTVTRILDVFGDFKDFTGLKDVVSLAVHDAVMAGSSQVTVLVSTPRLVPVFLKTGFLFSVVSRFCWYSPNPSLMASLAAEVYWTLGDSDNDSLE